MISHLPLVLCFLAVCTSRESFYSPSFFLFFITKKYTSTTPMSNTSTYNIQLRLAGSLAGCVGVGVGAVVPDITGVTGVGVCTTSAFNPLTAKDEKAEVFAS